jgi:hypothetical protein
MTTFVFDLDQIRDHRARPIVMAFCSAIRVAGQICFATVEDSDESQTKIVARIACGVAPLTAVSSDALAQQ